MFLSHNLTRSRSEFGMDLTTPRALFEGLVRPGRFLDWRNVLPALIVTWPVAMMQRIKDAKLRLACSGQDLQHVRNTLICFRNALQTVPHFASLGNEIVIGI